MNLNFIILLGSFIAGAMFAVMISGLIFTSNYKKSPDEPPKIGISQLHRHDIKFAVSSYRCEEEPDETIDRVKRYFAEQIIKQIDDSIEVMKDPCSRNYVFSMSIWTKEAADGQGQD